MGTELKGGLDKTERKDKELLIEGMPRAQYFASKRMKVLLQHVIDIENRDSRIHNVEVVHVEMSKDYKSANVKWRERIGFLPYMDMKHKTAILNHMTGFLGSRVANMGELRFAPKFDFYFDIDPRDTSVVVPKSVEEQMAEAYERAGFAVERPEPMSETELERRFVRYEDENDKHRRIKRAKSKSESEQFAMNKNQEHHGTRAQGKKLPSMAKVRRIKAKRASRIRNRHMLPAW